MDEARGATASERQNFSWEEKQNELVLEVADVKVAQLGVEPVPRRPSHHPVAEPNVASAPLADRHIERLGHGSRGALDVEWRDQERAVGGIRRHPSGF